MTEQTLILPWPPSANTYWRKWRNRIVKSDEARSYQEEAAFTAIVSGVRQMEGRVGISLHQYRPAKRGDIDNRIKVLLDAMNGLLYADDEQIEELHVYLDDDKDNPRVEVKAWGIV